MTGFREKPALSFDSQPFLYPVDGELCPAERGPQFIFSPLLGSCGHVVEGVSRSGGHIVLRNWNQQRETGCPPGPGGRCDFIPCLSGRHNGPYFNYSYEPLVNPNSAEPLSGSEPLSPGSAWCLPGAQLRASGILTLPGIIWARFHTSPPRRPRPTCVSMVTGPAPNQDGFQAALDLWLRLEFSLLQGEPTSLWVPHVPLLFTLLNSESLMRSWIYIYKVYSVKKYSVKSYK